MARRRREVKRRRRGDAEMCKDVEREFSASPGLPFSVSFPY